MSIVKDLIALVRAIRYVKSGLKFASSLSVLKLLYTLYTVTWINKSVNDKL